MKTADLLFNVAHANDALRDAVTIGVESLHLGYVIESMIPDTDAKADLKAVYETYRVAADALRTKLTAVYQAGASDLLADE